MTAKHGQPPPPVGLPSPQPVALGRPRTESPSPQVDPFTTSLASGFTIAFVGGSLLLGSRLGLNRESSAPPGTVDLVSTLFWIAVYGVGATIASLSLTGGVFAVARLKSLTIAWTTLFATSAIGTGALALLSLG